MYCKNCGTELDENNVCPNCPVQEEENNQILLDSNAGGIKPEQKKYSGNCIAGFVLSLVGFIVFAIPCGVLGLVFSCLGMKEADANSRKGKGLAISGLVVSILDIVFGLYNVISML